MYSVFLFHFGISFALDQCRIAQEKVWWVHMRYDIRGRVVDQFTDNDIGEVRGEAWDKDLRLLDDLLEAVGAQSRGVFSISFNEHVSKALIPSKGAWYNDLLASARIWSQGCPHGSHR